MAKKAFGFVSNIDGLTGVQFKYVLADSVIGPANGYNYAYVAFTYSDSPYTIWAAIVAAVRSAESDPSMVVVPAPSGLDFLMFGKTY